MNGRRSTLDLIARYVACLEARDWGAVGALLHPGVVYEIPQSRERVRGRDAVLAFNRAFPGDWHLRLAESYADDTGGVARIEAHRDGVDESAIVFFEFGDRLITAIRDWWPEPYEPPAGREHLVERY